MEPYERLGMTVAEWETLAPWERRNLATRDEWMTEYGKYGVDGRNVYAGNPFDRDLMARLLARRWYWTRLANKRKLAGVADAKRTLDEIDEAVHRNLRGETTEAEYQRMREWGI